MGASTNQSGEAWIGVVPERWRVEPLGRWFRERKTTVSDADFAPLSVTMQGIVPQLENVAKTDNNANRKLVLKGDFAINSRSDRKGSAGVSGLDGSVSVITTVLQPRGLDPRFTHHLLRSRPFQEEFYRWGHGIVDDLWSTKWSDMKSIKIPVPPEPEQRAIAVYLDRETAQIDAFIAKNEELITLLTERRRATIGSAVTRGIRRDAPTRPSGVAWLGDVPSHWSVAGLARYAGTVSGVGFPESEQGIEDEEIAFYKVNALGQADADGVIRKSWDTISRETARSLRAKILPPGTILLAKIGAAMLLGRIRRTDRPACIDNNMMAIVPNEHLNARFASYALQTFDFEALANPGTVPSMDMYAFMHRETAVPPLFEQEEIADYLDCRLARIDAALAKCRRGVHLARERRAALISAAVTGKIDVGVAA